MIELRYLIENGVKRLQYRTIESRHYDGHPIWSDWQDVPTVQVFKCMEQEETE